MKAVIVVRDQAVAQLLIDPMRRTIFTILADAEKTENQLAETLGLTDSGVGHHLKALEEVGLVRIVRREPEAHGILQKFYRSSALCFVIDTKKLPYEISRYFFPISIERVRGVLSVIQIMSKKLDSSSESVEMLSEHFANALVEVAENYLEKDVSSDRETFTVKLYSESLVKLLRRRGEKFQVIRDALSLLVTAKTK